MNLETIIFVSASDIGSAISGAAGDQISNARRWAIDQKRNGTDGYSGFIPVSFVGLNHQLNDPIETNQHRLGYQSASLPVSFGNDILYVMPKGGAVDVNNTVLNINSGSMIDASVKGGAYTSFFTYMNTGLIHKRNGPYGWPTWKQIRGGEHRVARWQRDNNIIAVLDNNIISIGNGKAKNLNGFYQFDDSLRFPVPLSADTQHSKKLFKAFTEPVFTSRFHPFKHSFIIEEGLTKTDYDLQIQNTYGNNLITFANQELRNKLGLETDNPEQIYDELKKIYVDGVLPANQNPFKRFVSLKYTETIYPREVNIGLNRTRNRERYNVGFWRDIREKRTSENHLYYYPAGKKFYQEDPINSQGFTITSQSMWPLDARTNYTADTVWQLTGGIDGAGELQNNYVQYHGQQNNRAVKAGPLYSRLVPMSSSTYQEAYIKIVVSGSSTYNTLLDGSTIEINSGSVAAGNLYTFTGTLTGPAGAGSNQWQWISEADAAALPGGPFDPADISNKRIARLINAQSASAAHEPLYLRCARSSSATPDVDAIQLWVMHLGARGNNFQIRISASDGTNTRFYVSSSAGAAANNTAVNFEYGSGDPVYFGGQTLWEAGEQANKSPFYDSYEKFSEDLRRVGKDFTLVPEFRVSEHIPKLVETNDGNFLVDLPEFLSVSGSELSSSAQDGFYKTYSTTDFLKYFDVLNQDHESLAYPSELTLTCKALMKFHPYDGFYPALRTVQLASLFSQSFGPIANVSGTQGSFRTLLQPFFAPGILYNTIKSGIAVDYPVYLKSTISEVDTAIVVDRGTRRKFLDEQNLPAGIETNTSTDALESTVDVSRGRGIDYVFGYDVGESTSVERIFDKRLPFESIINPLEYMNSELLIDDELHPSSSIDSFVNLDGIPSSLYSLAMNNFLASSIDFFLEEGKLTSFVSEPEVQYAGGTGYLIPDSKQNTKFVLDVMLINGDKPDLGRFIEEDLIAANGTGWLFAPNTKSWLTEDYVTNSISMYDDRKAFGNPIIERNTNVLANYSSSMPNYATVTPPYYDGLALARITFDPGGVPGVYSLEEIHQSMSIDYIRLSDTMPGIGYQSTPNSYDKLFMQVTASLTLDGIFKERKAVYGQQDGNNNFIVNGVEDDTNSSNHWVISTKFETPVLDFSTVSATSPTSGSARKGMWHQYGVDISDEPNKGIFLKLSDVNEFEQRTSGPYQSPLAISPNEAVESLADLVGFRKESKKVGRIAKSKTVKEAIVAIPYKKTQDDQMVFYSIPRKMIDFALGKDVLAPKTVKPGNSIIDMVNAMQDYVLPPKFDFITNPEINPFAMYIFEFEHTFTKQDLIDIWQNLPPESLRTIKEPKETSVSISHPLLIDEFYGITNQGQTGQIATETQWLVFKVKQKGKWNYFAKTEDSRDDDRFKFKFQFGRKGNMKTDELDYSYNWPYDYFTMIEMAKIDACVKYEPGKAVEVDQSTDSLPDINEVKDTVQTPTKVVLQKDGTGTATQSPSVGTNVPGNSDIGNGVL